MGETEKRLKELEIVLPYKDRKGKSLVILRKDGQLIYLSGHGCDKPNGKLLYEGRLGAEVNVEEGYKAARQVGINLLASLKDYLGNLDRIEKIIKVLGFVACTPDFNQQPQVMHGFSDLMTEVFGDRGTHARSAIGVAALPKKTPVEIEMIVKIKD